MKRTIARTTSKVLRPIIGRIHEQRVSLFADLPIAPGDIVFLGDSITQGGFWSDRYPELPVRNRGIDGDTSGGVLARLDQILGQPAAVFLMIGTNDLTQGVTTPEIAANVDRILRRIRLASPDTKIYLQSVLPRRRRLADRIVALNTQYRVIAQRHAVTFVDLFPLFADGERAIRSDYSNDHLHLLGAGYAVWVDAIKQYLVPARASVPVIEEYS